MSGELYSAGKGHEWLDLARYDPHKYDYLHAPLEYGWRGWAYRKECVCDGCFLWRQVKYQHIHDFKQDYTRLQEIMDTHPELDQEDAFNLMTSEEGDCIF